MLALALGLAACERPEVLPDANLPVFKGSEALIDDGADVPGFSTFRDSLRSIVDRQDTLALISIVAESAQLSYEDAPRGPEGLRMLWFDAQAPPSEPVWAVLDRLLAGGSVEEDGAFTIPFVAGLWPETLDPYGHVAAFGDTTVALASPQGPEVARLVGAHILPLADSTDSVTWHVRLPDGSTAYIARSSAVSPVGYRATFWQTADADWKLHVFVSGV